MLIKKKIKLAEIIVISGLKKSINRELHRLTRINVDKETNKISGN
jgi:hypothetical protein